MRIIKHFKNPEYIAAKDAIIYNGLKSSDVNSNEFQTLMRFNILINSFDNTQDSDKKSKIELELKKLLDEVCLKSNRDKCECINESDKFITVESASKSFYNSSNRLRRGRNASCSLDCIRAIMASDFANCSRCKNFRYAMYGVSDASIGLVAKYKLKKKMEAIYVVSDYWDENYAV